MNIEDYIGLLKGNGQHKCLYHFTDHRNLPSISQHGLLSMRELRQRGIQVPAVGGNEWSLTQDVRVGMDRFVHLCLFDSHPMEYGAKKAGHITHTKFLRIDPAVLRTPGVLVTNEVANQSGVVAKVPLEILDQLDFEVIYSRTDWKNPAIIQRRNAAKRYEVLIPTHIPLNLILNL